jgi:hypothetical protein
LVKSLERSLMMTYWVISLLISVLGNRFYSYKII